MKKIANRDLQVMEIASPKALKSFISVRIGIYLQEKSPEAFNDRSVSTILPQSMPIHLISTSEISAGNSALGIRSRHLVLVTDAKL